MSITIKGLDNGMAVVTFDLPATEHEGSVSVVGSFNEWTAGAHEMHPVDDQLRLMIQVPLGEEIHFRYLGENGHWFDDPDVETDSDGGHFTATAGPATEAETESAEDVQLPTDSVDLTESTPSAAATTAAGPSAAGKHEAPE